MVSQCCGSGSPPQASNFDDFEFKNEFPPFENMIFECKCLHTEKKLPKIYVNILFEIQLYVKKNHAGGIVVLGSAHDDNK